MFSSDVAFSPAVKQVQQRKGRPMHKAIEAHGGFRTALTDELIGFLSIIDTAYLVTASADGQPYAQHRGGPKGFIRHLEGQTLAFVDFKGNQQFVTTGNLSENPKAFLFLMDYAHQQRVKLWGHARVVEGDRALIDRLMPEGYKARPEQVILFDVDAWDTNCNQHIPRKFDAPEVLASLNAMQTRISSLESENALLKARLSAAEAPSRAQETL
jgi:predicted pyridoxine 5'-phosphate oxidase superfamily flavin-nucleotide-binding protein